MPVTANRPVALDGGRRFLGKMVTAAGRISSGLLIQLVLKESIGL